jgi:hypothetical protein
LRTVHRPHAARRGGICGVAPATGSHPPPLAQRLAARSASLRSRCRLGVDEGKAGTRRPHLTSLSPASGHTVSTAALAVRTPALPAEPAPAHMRRATGGHVGRSPTLASPLVVPLRSRCAGELAGPRRAVAQPTAPWRVVTVALVLLRSACLGIRYGLPVQPATPHAE